MRIESSGPEHVSLSVSLWVKTPDRGGHGWVSPDLSPSLVMSGSTPRYRVRWRVGASVRMVAAGWTEDAETSGRTNVNQ